MTAPLERMKILQQTSGIMLNGHQLPHPVHRTAGMIYQQGGVTGFYKGLSANLLRIIPQCACKFMFYDIYLKEFEKISFLNKEEKSLSISNLHLIAGGAAALSQTFITYPFDLIRTCMTMPQASYRSVWHCYSIITAARGVKGLYQGMGASAIGVVPYHSVSFGLYEFFKSHLPRNIQTFVDLDEDILENTNALIYHENQVAKGKQSKQHNTPISFKFICGAAAGIMAQTLTFPLDAIRRRIQIQSTPFVIRSHYEQPYRNAMDGAGRIIREEGWRSLYRGCSINLIKVGPSAGLQFIAYEWAKEIFKI